MRADGYMALVTTTYENQEDAPLLGVCRTMQQVHSTYEWQGKVESTMEWEVTYKVPRAQMRRVILALKQTHPYEVPYISWRIVKVTGEYARWAKGTRGLGFQ